MNIRRTNTILYCNNWQNTVDFYRGTLGFPVSHESDWFIEFQITSQSYLSVADTRKATIASSAGRGITLTWQVEDVGAAYANLKRQGVAVTPIKQKWGARQFFIYDPEGHRIELWQPVD